MILTLSYHPGTAAPPPWARGDNYAILSRLPRPCFTTSCLPCGAWCVDNPLHWTPLMFAAIVGTAMAVTTALPSGPVEARDALGRTALMIAARNGKDEAVSALVDLAKADVEARDEEQKTPLLHAAEMGHAKTVDLLLRSHGADAGARDKADRTAYDLAVAYGHEDAQAVLVRSPRRHGSIS
jgi:ankyrin repeat protein